MVKPCDYYSTFTGTQACHCPQGAQALYDDLVFEVKTTHGETAELRIKVEDYVLEVFDDDGNIDHCAVFIDYLDDSEFYDPKYGYGILLGDSFVRSYYLIHDKDKSEGA